jgi:SSS family solute:Na+ symporter
MVVAVVGLRLVSLSTRRYMRGVSDFLSANRVAGRYLLTIASQMGGTGVVSFIALFEMFYGAGLAPNWWSTMLVPAYTIVALSGWIYYRFRETRAMTMAQFLEMRYSRRLRIFAGILCWTSGVVNFGIFPVVAARFFIYFCGIPAHFHLPGLSWAIPTVAPVMLVDLGLAVSFVNMGGQISVMITECAQGIFCGFAFIVVAAAVLVKVHWGQMVQAMAMAPKNASMLNPFHTSGVKDFNIWYFAIAVFGVFYGYMSWQGAQGFYSSARTPHEQKMGQIIGGWRTVPQGLAICTLALATIAIMRLPQFADQARIVSATLAKIPNTSVQGQMRVPIAMAHVLPTAVKGLLATIFLFYSFTCHDTYMHSWGSIFIQDVYMPIRNKVIDAQQHIKLLRWSIIFVAIFSFVFGLLYNPTEKILFFFAITGTIWLGGSGAVIVGGLYWRRGTTAAAFCALIVGMVAGVGGLIVPQIYLHRTHHHFPINNQWLWFLAMLSAAVVYALVSLATSGKSACNLDKILHRGEYRTAADHPHAEVHDTLWFRLVGITKEFSRGDRALAIVMLVWNTLGVAWFVIFTIVNLLRPVSNHGWALNYFIGGILVPVVLCLPVTIWFTIGGAMDIRLLFKRLAASTVDPTDDGRVVGFHDNEPEAAGSAASMPERS